MQVCVCVYEKHVEILSVCLYFRTLFIRLLLGWLFQRCHRTRVANAEQQSKRKQNRPMEMKGSSAH